MFQLGDRGFVGVQPFDRLLKKNPLRFGQRQLVLDLIRILRGLYQRIEIGPVIGFGLLQIIGDDLRTDSPTAEQVELGDTLGEGAHFTGFTDQVSTDRLAVLLEQLCALGRNPDQLLVLLSQYLGVFQPIAISQQRGSSYC